LVELVGADDFEGQTTVPLLLHAFLQVTRTLYCSLLYLTLEPSSLSPPPTACHPCVMSSLNAALSSVRDSLHSSRSDATAASSDSSARSVIAEVNKKGSKKDATDSGGSGGGGGGGGKQELSAEDEASPILVFCRIRPSRGSAAPKQMLALDTEEKQVEFNVPKATDNGSTVNNTRENFKFHFNGLFDESTTQEDIFEGIGKRVVDNVIAGYNGFVASRLNTQPHSCHTSDC
jgi:hypothetical protein